MFRLVIFCFVIILSDNVLWSGKVINENQDVDQDTKALIEYSKKVQNDNRASSCALFGSTPRSNDFF